MKISVIIPVHNGAHLLRRCLAAVQADEVIVVDDGSRDESGNVAAELGALVIRLSESAGPARARNLGAQAATGDVLFFVDADVVIHSDAVAQVRAAFTAQPDVVAVFGSYDDTPGESNFLSQYKNLLHHYVHQTGNEEAATFWAGCGAIRRTVFAQMGGFDQRWRHKIEDIELGYRLRRVGYRVRLVKTLQATHLKRWTVRSLLYTDFFIRALPWTMLILRDGRLANDLNLRWSSRVCVAASWVLPAALMIGWWWIAAAAAAALLVLNVEVYRFFARKRGFWFMLGVIPWHSLYYFYSGLAFAVGFVRHLLSRSTSASQ